MPSLAQTHAGRILRNLGMKKATSTANKNSPGWADRALEMLDICPLAEFMVEDIRNWAYQHGLDRPNNDRAWGGVIARANFLGIVEHIGFKSVKNPLAHCTPASYWRRIATLEEVRSVQ